MLNLRMRALRSDRTCRGLAELLPWLTQLTPGLILNKDGGLLASFEVRSGPGEGAPPEAMERAAERLEQAMRHFNARITLWSTTLRRAAGAYSASPIQNPASAAMDQLYRSGFTALPTHYNRHYFSVLYAQEPVREGWVGALLDEDQASAHNGQPGSHTQVRRAGVWRRGWRALRLALGLEEAFAHDCRQLERRITRFEELLGQFCGSLAGIGLDRLENDALLGFLNEVTSPASAPGRFPRPGAGAYLDTALGDNTVVVERDHLRFEGVERVCFGAALAVKCWPTSTWVGMLDQVLAVPVELTLSQVFRFVEPEAAKSYIKNVQRFHLNLQKSLFSYVREAVSGEESVVRDTGRAVSAEDARAALTDIVAARRVFGYQNLTLLVYSTHREELEYLVGQVAAPVQAQGYLLLRERLHLNSAWSGSLPGQWGELVRWHFISTSNWVDLCPLQIHSSGAAENAYLTRQTGRLAPALTLFRTRQGAPYFFNLHQQDLGHALVVGPSRSGKSVWVNFILSQFQRYDPVRIYIFDKDRSCRIPTLLQGGSWFDPLAPDSAKLNPLQRAGEPAQHPWMARWLSLLLSAHGRTLDATDHAALFQALAGLSLLAPPLRRLSSLYGLLPRVLRDELEPWLEGSAQSCFDNEQDGFELAAMTCMEMGSVLRTPQLARPFLEFMFHRIDQQLAQACPVPTLIYIEEAWFMLGDEHFAARIRDWLKTLPKKLGAVILATQSLDDLSDSSIFTSIADNIPTRIFLPNSRARVHEKVYRTQFGLNAGQIESIERATPKRHYYLDAAGEYQLLEASFSPQLLAWLRSDAQAQTVFDRYRNSGDPEWKAHYRSALLQAESA